MAQLDFYNHNANIAYPMIELDRSGLEFSGGYILLENAFVDAGFLLGIDAVYDDQYRIKLVSIAVNGSDVVFQFTDESATTTFSFACTTGDAFGTIHTAYASEGTNFGEGFLVTGDLNLGFPDGLYTAAADYYVEEGVVQTLHMAFVKQLTIGSEPRVAWHVPADCGGSITPMHTFSISARNLTGNQQFKPGYNCIINVYDDINTIEITAGSGAGEGLYCPPVIDSSSLSLFSSLSMSSVSDLLSSLSSVSQSLASQSSTSQSSASQSSESSRASGSSKSSESSASQSSKSSASQLLSSLSLSSGLTPTTCKDVFNTINGVWPDTTGNFLLTALSAGLKVTGYPSLHKVVIEFNAGANTPFCQPGS